MAKSKANDYAEEWWGAQTTTLLINQSTDSTNDIKFHGSLHFTTFYHGNTERVGEYDLSACIEIDIFVNVGLIHDKPTQTYLPGIKVSPVCDYNLLDTR